MPPVIAKLKTSTKSLFANTALPTRSQLLGGLAGILAWAIVAILQAYGLLPFIATAAPYITGIMKALGILPTNFYYAGQPGVDPVAGLVLILTKMFVSHILLKYWPSGAEVDMAIETAAEYLPSIEAQYPAGKNGEEAKDIAISQGPENGNFNKPVG